MKQKEEDVTPPKLSRLCCGCEGESRQREESGLNVVGRLNGTMSGERGSSGELKRSHSLRKSRPRDRLSQNG